MIEQSPFGATGAWAGAELYYSDAWHAIIDDVSDGGIQASTGLRGEAGQAEPGRLTVRLTNSAGVYSPRHPGSPLHGLIGRSTPMRAWLDLGAGWLDISASGYASTVDTAELSITGDLDLRWYGRVTDWRDEIGLICKSFGAGQRSWLLAVVDGVAELLWSADGTTWQTVAAQVPIPAWATTIALRATLDADDGAGGHTVTLSWAPDLGGPWTALGEPNTGTGVTSIFDSTAPVSIGYGTGASRVYGWEIRDGIDGDLVSSCSCEDLAIGTGPITDDQAALWTLTSSSVTHRHSIGAGRIASWPIEWGRRGAPSAMTSIEAAGPTRRLGQGGATLQGALYAGIMAMTTRVAYWPCEDGPRSSRIATPHPGGRPMTITGAPDFQASDSFDCSAPVLAVGTASLDGRIASYAATGTVCVRVLVDLPSSGMADGDVILSIYTTGTVARVDLVWTTAGGLRLDSYDAAGAADRSAGPWGFGAVDVAWRISVELVEDGADVDVAVSAMVPGISLGGGGATWSSRTIGRATRVVINPGRTCSSSMGIGHLVVQDDVSEWLPAQLAAWIGDEPVERLDRIAEELDTTISVIGRPGAGAALGPQRIDTALAAIRDVEAADGGILYDAGDDDALVYRTSRSMCSAPPAVTIAYDDNLVVPFEPVDDDATLRNRVTVTREGGTSEVAQLASGHPMAICEVGLYDDSTTLLLHTDEQASLTAAWLLHLGTWDEARYPELGVDLAHPTLLADQVLTRSLLDLDVGDRLVITDPPAWLPPAAVDVIVVGRSIDVTPMHVRLTWSCIPARPRQVMHWGDVRYRWSAPATVTAQELDATETEIEVAGPDDVAWTHDDGDYDVVIDDERMTVTGVAGDVLTVTRGAVPAAHAVGATVLLADPTLYGL